MNAPAAPPEREIVAVVDPMCSWCWGFSPALEGIERDFGAVAPLTIVVGGLRPLTKRKMDAKAKAEIREHWQHVQEASGQPFDFEFFAREGFVYDTEPACRALVTVRTLKREAARDFLDRAHRAFYAENKDVTDADVLADIAEAAGVAKAGFVALFNTIDIVYETAGDFHAARRLGVNGFPTVLLRAGNAMSILTAGFQPYERIAPAIEAWLKSPPPAATRAGADLF